MADQLFNYDTDAAAQYQQYSQPPPPTFTSTVVGGDVTIVTNINGASGGRITFEGAAIGVAFTGSQGGVVTMSISNPTLFRVSISAAASGINTDITQLNGASQVDVSGVYKVNGVQVLAARDTGWIAPTGVASKAGFNTATATLTEVAQTLKALIDALTTQGEIGA